MVGLRSTKWPAHQAQISASAIGCLSNMLPMRAALNKSVTFCLLVNRVGEDLYEGQSHAMFPSFQMLESTRAVCQASMSLTPLASHCSSGFAAKEVLRPVSMRRNPIDMKRLLAMSMHHWFFSSKIRCLSLIGSISYKLLSELLPTFIERRCSATSICVSIFVPCRHSASKLHVARTMRTTAGSCSADTTLLVKPPALCNANLDSHSKLHGVLHSAPAKFF